VRSVLEEAKRIGGAKADGTIKVGSFRCKGNLAGGKGGANRRKFSTGESPLWRCCATPSSS
jgi:hypothetical protein